MGIAAQMIIVIAPTPCNRCGGIVHAFIQSKEEHDNFVCKDCTDNINTTVIENEAPLLENITEIDNTSSDKEGGEEK